MALSIISMGQLCILVKWKMLRCGSDRWVTAFGTQNPDERFEAPLYNTFNVINFN
jgi:hypothetical protein